MFSFGITAENFEVFENDTFDCKVLCRAAFVGCFDDEVISVFEI